jgi:chromosome segregation ATPase
LSNKCKEISKLAEENEVLKAQIALFRDNSKALVSQVDEIEKEKTDQAFKLKESNSTIEIWKSQLNESKAKEVILNDQLVNLNAMVASIQNQLEEKNTCLESSQQALSKEKLLLEISNRPTFI